MQFSGYVAYFTYVNFELFLTSRPPQILLQWSAGQNLIFFSPARGAGPPSNPHQISFRGEAREKNVIFFRSTYLKQKLPIQGWKLQFQRVLGPEKVGGADTGKHVSVW